MTFRGPDPGPAGLGRGPGRGGAARGTDRGVDRRTDRRTDRGTDRRGAGRGTDRDVDRDVDRGTAVVHNDEPATWETGSALGGVRGVPWWAAVLLALAFTGIGVFVDLERIDRLGFIFQGCYFLGCLLAVLWVQRRGLFGPMVQPPLILAVTVPGVVLATGGGGADGGLTAKALAVGSPLVNGFPTMAVTTGLTVLVGLLRIVVQRPPRPPRVRSSAGQPVDRRRPVR